MRRISVIEAMRRLKESKRPKTKGKFHGFDGHKLMVGKQGYTDGIRVRNHLWPGATT